MLTYKKLPNEEITRVAGESPTDGNRELIIETTTKNSRTYVDGVPQPHVMVTIADGNTGRRVASQILTNGRDLAALIAGLQAAGRAL